jgi:predicted aspartyl protease
VRCVARKKTVSLFQSHVFKHEFFLLESCPFPVPSDFEIDLIGGDDLSFPVETMLDTGFTEYLAMNKQDVQSLDWSFLNQDKLRTAQGETEFDVYMGKVIIDGQEWEVLYLLIFNSFE